MVLIGENVAWWYRAVRLVSVPLRGLWFLSLFAETEKEEEIALEFPSPCGDYGSYQRGSDRAFLSGIFAVSVPLRGLWFLSAGRKRIRPERSSYRFRPLAGIMVLIVHRMTKEEFKVMWFPSPCGDYGSYRKTGGYIANAETVSVPLRGLWFLSR